MEQSQQMLAAEDTPRYPVDADDNGTAEMDSDEDGSDSNEDGSDSDSSEDDDDDDDDEQEMEIDPEFSMLWGFAAADPRTSFVLGMPCPANPGLSVHPP